MRRRPLLALVALLLLALAASSSAQRYRGFGRRAYLPEPTPYNGKFTLARLWYAGHSGWSFDWPDMEQNLTSIVKELTSLDPHDWGGTVLRMDDPELFKFPVSYLSEPGYWYPSESEAEGLRTYLAKGGFLIVDDFHFPEEWYVFERAMRLVLPDARIDRLTIQHPVFNTFFAIPSLEVPYPGRLGQMGLMGEFYGIYRNNDVKEPLQVVINYNIDIGDYMEHSARGLYAVDPTNEAYKFGINYLIYGLTR